MKRILVYPAIISSVLFILLITKANAGDFIAENIDKAAAAITRTIFIQKYLNGIIKELQTADKEGEDAGDRSGSTPTTAHVQDWRALEANAQQRGERIYKAILANTPLCDYLDTDIKNAYRIRPSDKNISLDGQSIRINDLDPFTLKYRCTMPEGFDIGKYEDDPVANGGWEAFDRLLEPQNNVFGVLLGADSELSKQRAYEEQVTRDRVIANRGHKGKKEPCKTDSLGQCVFQGKIVTAGDTQAEIAPLPVRGWLDELINRDFSSEFIAQTLINKIISGSIKYLEDIKNAQLGDVINPNDPDAIIESEKMEYCTAQNPQPTIFNKYKSVFPPILSDNNGNPIPPVCGVIDPENPFPQQTCIQQCFQALGLTPVGVPGR